MKLYRAFFEKRGEAAFISHLDLQRVMGRALKRSGIPIWYTQGFNPHIYMTFALPLSLGQESVCESMDFKCEEELESEEAAAAINRGLPQGIFIQEVEEARMKTSLISSADYKALYVDGGQKVLCAYRELLALPQVFVEKQNKKKQVITLDIKDEIHVLSMELQGEDALIYMNLPCGNDLTVNPALVCDYTAAHFGLPPHREGIIRTAIYDRQGAIFR